MAAGAAVKGIGSLIIFSGLTYGGREVYLIVQSGNWEDELKRQGVRLPNEEDTNFYEGILKDQDVYLKGHHELKNKNNNTALKEWCEGERKKKFHRWSGNNSVTLKTLQRVCSVEGVNTIKGWILSKSITTPTFISTLKESEQQTEYKKIFSLYRFEDTSKKSELLEWLNDGINDDKEKLNSSSKLDKYTKLKDKCEKILKIKHGNKSDTVSTSDLNNLFKWCVKIKDENNTIAKRLKNVAADRDNREQITGGDLDNLINTWQNTNEQDRVEAIIKKEEKSKSKSTLDNEDYKNFCQKYTQENSETDGKLTDEDQYQEKYIVVGSVCYKAKG